MKEMVSNMLGGFGEKRDQEWAFLFEEILFYAFDCDLFLFQG